MSQKRDDTFERGMDIRREVLGDGYVDRAEAAHDPFWDDLRAVIVEQGWAGVWGREGLDRRTRSLLNIAMLSALGRPHELETHLRGAANTGCTKDDIREVILQIATYCGLPAALDTMRIAKAVFESTDFPSDN